jgi:site-specific DNA recombinase
MNPVIIYARVSTQEQADSRLGVESQLARCRDFVRMRGYAPPITLIDAGVSASVPLLARPSGSQILMARESTVIALCQDRLFRSVADMLVTMEVLDDLNADVITVDDGPLDLKDDDRWLASMMRAVFGELERRKTSTRTKRALQALRDRGGKIG